MVNSNEIKKDSDSKKILTMVIMVLTLMICTTSATYAYFAIAPVTNNTVTGTAASAGLSLTVSKSSPTTDGKLVPQLEAGLGTAMNSTNKCVDGNGNVVCQVYTITVNNTSSAAVVVNGTITFSGSTNMPNLKWRKTTSATTLGTGTTTAANVATAQTLVSSQSLTASNASVTTDSATYYIVIWINETGAAQTDTGTFRATIEFTSSNGTGITSTITS